MKILISNDDGINAPGIRKLAEAAAAYGEVTIVAPENQCSAMSQRINVFDPLRLRQVDFGMENVTAWSVGGTPADCLKVAIEYLKLKPDVCFSGINRGYNAGYEIAYSGTVGAAMEALMKGVPAIAFSAHHKDDTYSCVDRFFPELMEKLLPAAPGPGKIWNVNFPECPAEECKGILYDRTIANRQSIPDQYKDLGEAEGGGKSILLVGEFATEYEEGTDLNALFAGYVSVGAIQSMVCR